MTYDKGINEGFWSGYHLEVAKRMADYTVDGARFGSLELETRSGSPNDVHLAKRVSEVHTAALIFSYQLYERIELISLGSEGRHLERPDFDARLPDGRLIGIEVAEVSETDLRKHESGRNLIEVAVNDLLDADPAFKAAMGRLYLSLTLSAVGPYRASQIQSKAEAQAIAHEIEAFVRSGRLTIANDDFFATFPPSYPTLHARGAQYHAEPIETGPSFTVADGAGAIGRRHRSSEVMHVLDRHRQAAEQYRPLPLWIFLLLTDPFELFYNTLNAIDAKKPAITPFERACIADATSKVLIIE